MLEGIKSKLSGLSKRKLIFWLVVFVLVLGSASSLVAAKTGHFNSLAKVLHIGADTNLPSNIWITGTSNTTLFTGEYDYDSGGSYLKRISPPSTAQSFVAPSGTKWVLYDTNIQASYESITSDLCGAWKLSTNSKYTNPPPTVSGCGGVTPPPSSGSGDNGALSGSEGSGLGGSDTDTSSDSTANVPKPDYYSEFAIAGTVKDTQGNLLANITVQPRVGTLDCLKPASDTRPCTIKKDTSSAPFPSTVSNATAIKMAGETWSYNYILPGLFTADAYGRQVSSYTIDFTSQAGSNPYYLGSTQIQVYDASRESTINSQIVWVPGNGDGGFIIHQDMVLVSSLGSTGTTTPATTPTVPVCQADKWGAIYDSHTLKNIAGAKITILDSSGTIVTSTTSDTTSETNTLLKGRNFATPDIPCGTNYTVTVEAPGYDKLTMPNTAFSSTEILTSTSEKWGLDLSTTCKADKVATIYNNQNKEIIVGATVTISNNNNQVIAAAKSTDQTSGKNLVTPDVPCGKYNIDIKADGYIDKVLNDVVFDSIEYGTIANEKWGLDTVAKSTTFDVVGYVDDGTYALPGIYVYVADVKCQNGIAAKSPGCNSNMPFNIYDKSIGFALSTNTNRISDSTNLSRNGNYHLQGLQTIDINGQKIDSIKLNYYLNSNNLANAKPDASIFIHPNSDKMLYDAKTGRYFINPPMVTFPPSNPPSANTSVEYRIHFKNAANGAAIDLTKESITENELSCIDQSNNENSCVTKKEADSSDSSRSTYIYTIDEGTLKKAGIINTGNELLFETTRYIFIGDMLDPNIKEATVYLINKKSPDDSVYCEVHNGTNFCTYTIQKSLIFTAARKSIMDQMGALYTQLGFSTNTPLPDVFILDGAQFRAFARYNQPVKFSKARAKYYIAYQSSYLDKQDITTWIHEFSHIVDKANGLNNGQKTAFASAFNGAQASNCSQFGYKCLSSYGTITNSQELWAEFFSDWIVNYQDVVDMLNDPKVTEQCKNALKALLSIMHDHFGTVPHYTISKHPVSSPPIPPSNNKNYRASKAGFDSLMLSLGYDAVPESSIDTISPIAQLGLTSDQIASGMFLKNNYNALSLTQKTSLQLNIVKNQIIDAINNNSAVNTIRSKIASLNTQIETLLGKIGIKFTNAKITGTVHDQNGVIISNYSITVGDNQGRGKTDVTDKNGQFSIKRLPTGTQTITISDPKTGNRYQVSIKVKTAGGIVLMDASTLDVAKDKSYSMDYVITK